MLSVPIFLLTETNITVEESDTTVELCVELVESFLSFPIEILIEDGTTIADILGVSLPGDRMAVSKHPLFTAITHFIIFIIINMCACMYFFVATCIG